MRKGCSQKKIFFGSDQMRERWEDKRREKNIVFCRLKNKSIKNKERKEMRNKKVDKKRKIEKKTCELDMKPEKKILLGTENIESLRKDSRSGNEL